MVDEDEGKDLEMDVNPAGGPDEDSEPEDEGVPDNGLDIEEHDGWPKFR